MKLRSLHNYNEFMMTWLAKLNRHTIISHEALKQEKSTYILCYKTQTKEDIDPNLLSPKTIITKWKTLQQCSTGPHSKILSKWVMRLTGSLLPPHHQAKTLQIWSSYYMAVWSLWRSISQSHRYHGGWIGWILMNTSYFGVVKWCFKTHQACDLSYAHRALSIHEKFCPLTQCICFTWGILPLNARYTACQYVSS